MQQVHLPDATAKAVGPHPLVGVGLSWASLSQSNCPWRTPIGLAGDFNHYYKAASGTEAFVTSDDTVFGTINGGLVLLLPGYYQIEVEVQSIVNDTSQPAFHFGVSVGASVSYGTIDNRWRELAVPSWAATVTDQTAYNFSGAIVLEGTSLSGDMAFLSPSVGTNGLYSGSSVTFEMMAFRSAI